MADFLEKSKRYKVAGHIFEVSQGICEGFFAKFMDNYAPFIVDESSDVASASNLSAIKVEHSDEIPH